MKIITKVGNLMNIKSGHVVHGCNAQGVMGSGVALAVKKTYPRAFEEYRQQYDEFGLDLGVAYPSHMNDISNDLIIWNAITQDAFGPGLRQTSYDAVQTCFQQINDAITAELVRYGPIDPDQNEDEHTMFELTAPKEIHIPLIGAARGGGNWEIIREIIEQTVIHPVTLWLPDDTVTTK